MFFKKKRKLVVEERTQDSKPFEIPKILDEIEKKGYKRDHFVSPVFGTNVKDSIVIPNPHKRSGDMDLQYDGFRTRPRMTKEKMKEKYGTEYPEFDLLKGKNLNEAMQSKNNRKKVYQETNEQATRVVEEVVVEEKVIIPESSNIKTNINDFFSSNSEKDFVSPHPKLKEKPALNKYNKEYKFPTLSLLSKPLQKVKDNHEWVQKQIEIVE